MVLTTRRFLVTGLGLVSLGLMTGRLLGQGQTDERVRPAGTTNASAANGTASKTTVPPVIGTIDMERALKDYEKYKFLAEEFNASVLAKNNELMKLRNQMQQQAEAMQKFTPGTADFKKHENEITLLKAQMDAKKEQYERDFEMGQAESMATLYKDIQDMASRTARIHKMNYVLKVSGQPITGGDPRSVMAAMANTIIYSDPNNDITSEVIGYLNVQYRRNGGQPPKGNVPATARAGQPDAAKGAQQPGISATPAAAAAPRGTQR